MYVASKNLILTSKLDCYLNSSSMINKHFIQWLTFPVLLKLTNSHFQFSSSISLSFLVNTKIMMKSINIKTCVLWNAWLQKNWRLFEIIHFLFFILFLNIFAALIYHLKFLNFSLFTFFKKGYTCLFNTCIFLFLNHFFFLFNHYFPNQ